MKAGATYGFADAEGEEICCIKREIMDVPAVAADIEIG